MIIFQAIILGIVQGLSEFLPISSSGHLVLVPAFFGWKDLGLNFDVVLHFGSVVALVWFFWKDWKKLLLALISSIKNRKIKTVDEKLIWYILAATIPAGVLGYFYQDGIETYFRHPLFVAYALIVMGALLYFGDEMAQKIKSLEKITFWNAFLIGIFQAIALLPGVSRSGITMLAGRIQKFDRVAAARFSFLLATPIILAATINSAMHFQTDNLNILALILGVIAAVGASFLAIKFLLNYLEKHSFAYLALYSIILGIISLLIFKV